MLAQFDCIKDSIELSVIRLVIFNASNLEGKVFPTSAALLLYQAIFESIESS